MAMHLHLHFHLRRSRIDRMVAWSPVAILAAVAALTWWLDAQVQRRPFSGDGATRHDPDLFMEKFSAVSLGPDGSLRNRLTAAGARHFPDDRTTELEAPTFVVTEPGRPRLEVRADRGRISGDRQHAYFYGNVRAVRAEAGPNQPVTGPLTLETEYLHVVPKTQKLSTDKPVTITEPRAIIRGTGLDYDHEARTLRILSGVSGQFTPTKK